MTKVSELFGVSTQSVSKTTVKNIQKNQECPYTNSKCFKVSKSKPEISIGTCTVNYGRQKRNIIICPNRLLQNKQVFMDCLQLLTRHEQGNEFHVISEVSIPGGSVDYFIASAKNGKVKDFVGIEFQTLDTTGTVWPERQRILKEYGIEVDENAVNSTKSFGMNWKFTDGKNYSNATP